MATIDSLAPELLDDILEHLLTEWEQPDLYAASIVCRRWQDPAQRVLFQNVVLPNKSMANAWLQSPARPRYRARSLAMGHWGDSPLSMEILAACPDLRSLCLDYKSEDGGYEWCSSAHVEGLAILVIRYPENFPIDASPLRTRNLRHLRVYVDDREVNSHEAIFSSSRHSLEYLSLECLDEYSAPALVQRFAEEPFPLVRHLVLDKSLGFEFWPRLTTSLTSLVTLEIAHAPLMGTIEDSVAAVGVAVVPTLQNLILTGIWMKENTIEELLSILKLPNLVGIRRLEIPKVQKDNLAGEAGLALLDECEERSISLLCRYGWLTRDMMKVASPARD